ncbi:MAG: hypothetical protein JWN25_1454 [Verrucomicrobiales bacterium]|nr:hypothetical protein [Verrucomicrobiales bacterium]
MGGQIAMEISKEEASKSLEAIQATNELTRMTAARIGGPILITWGVIWVVGFAINQFLPASAGLGWMILDLLGGIITWRISVRMSAIKSRHDPRVFLFFLILMVFGAVWAFLLSPFNARHFGAYIVTLFMFAYVVGGLWFGRFYIILGALVTLLVLAGVFLAGSYESLWLGCAGGGSLIVSGLYIIYKGPRAGA